MKILLANLVPAKTLDGKYGTVEKKFNVLMFPMGLGIIAALLKKYSYNFDTYDSYVNGTTDGFLQELKKGSYTCVMLSGFLGNYNYSFIKDITNKIKQISTSIKIIIGGPMASTIPELLIKNTKVNYVVVGEGEVTIIELLKDLEKNSEITTTKGVYFKDEKNNISFLGDNTRITELDNYPFPDYASFPIDKYVKYLKDTDRLWDISSSRGCYAKCNFCKLTFGQKISSYSYENLLNHMNQIYHEYGINGFNFVDDNFLNSPKAVDNFINLLQKNKVKFKWRFQGRADRINHEQVKRMKEVGLYDISFGIESGSQVMLEKYGKKLNLQKAKDNLKEIKRVLSIHATFIIGGLGENWETIRETEKFIRDLKLNNSAFGILTLFPQTTFYDYAIKRGMITDEDEYCMNLGQVYVRPYTNISDLSNEELLEAKALLESVSKEYGEYE